MKSFLAVLFLTLLMSGCATVAGTGAAQNAAGNQLQKITEADLAAAIQDAADHNDSQAVLCYTEIQKLVGKGLPTSNIKGVLSTFEAARLLRRNIQGGVVPDALHNACAPLIVDANITLVKLGLIAGGL